MRPTHPGVDFLKRLGMIVAAVLLAHTPHHGAASDLEDQQTFRILANAPHTGAVSAVAFSPDGRRMISGSLDKSLKLWEVASGRLMRTLTGHSDAITSVAFSADGRKAASGSSDGGLKFWDLLSGRPIRAQKAHSGEVASLAFSPGGELVVTGSSKGTIKFWDGDSGALRQTRDGHVGGVLSIAFSPDGTRFASRGRLDIKIWDVASASLLHTFKAPSGRPSSFAFSPDGRKLVSESPDRKLGLWDVASGQLLKTFKTPSGKLLSVAFSEQGKTIVSASEGALRVWDANSGRLLRALSDHEMESVSAAISPDGRKVVFVSLAGTLKLWDAISGRLIRALKSRSIKDLSVSFSDDGGTIISGGLDEVLSYWDATTGQLIRTAKGPAVYVPSIAVSPDGARMLTIAERVIKLWDAASGRLLRTLNGHSDTVSSFAFSPDGRSVVSGSRDRTVRLWDAATGRQLQTMAGHSGAVESVAFSPDGKRIVSASTDATLRLWDVENGALLIILVGAPAESDDKDFRWLAMTPEGFLAASTRGSNLLHAVRGLDVIGIDELFDSLYRPDLVEEKLAGDPNNKVLLAAQKLDLQKILESGAPPGVKIAAPANGIRIPGNTVTVNVTLTDRGGGIGRIEFRVNGVHKGDDRGGNDKSAVKKRELELASEENEIEVAAYNKEGLVASPPVKVVVHADKTAISKPPTLYVMAIGANDYGDPDLRLKYAALDATALSNAFARIGQDREIYGNVIIKSLLNSEITKETVSKTFAELGHNVKAHDVFVLYVCGRGTTVDRKYFFLPANFRREGRDLAAAILQDGISQDNWRTWLSLIKAERSLLIFDTFGLDAGAHSIVSGRNANPEHRAAVEKLAGEMGRPVLAASGSAKTALEGYKEHGVLAYALLEGLATADLSEDFGNHNDRIELRELIEHVQHRLPQISALVTGNNQELSDPHQLRRQPLMRGVNFTIAKPYETAPDKNAAPTVKIPTRPTHVVVDAANLFTVAGGRGTAIGKLRRGILVTAMEIRQGWVLVARDGIRLGFVENKHLAPVR